MNETNEHNRKEEMYRSEIFKLLIDSLGELSEKDKKLLNDLFMEDKISDEDLIKRIIE